MNVTKIFSNQVINLRRQAEEKASKIIEKQEALSLQEIRQMFHELSVHQIEFEMQNEKHVIVGDHAELPHAFLGKPYRIEELRDTIHRVLANKTEWF